MVENLIKKIARQLDKAKIPYMIIGGQAVLLYGSPRLTRDIDITLGIDTDRLPSIKKLCEYCGLRILPRHSQEFAQDTKVLPAEEPKSKIRVDFIFSFTPYEQQAIKRAKTVLMGDYPARFASCEDLLIYKMFAGRAIDAEDVENILIKNKKKINFKYVEKWLSEFGRITDRPEMLKSFKKLKKGVFL